MFAKKYINICGRDGYLISGLGNYSLTDTFECGQCFRHVRVSPASDGAHNEIGRTYQEYVEYMTVVKDRVVLVGQRNQDELIFFDTDEEFFENTLKSYFSLEVDYEAIKEDILSHTDSEFLHKAASASSGIRILKQDPWETLFSFIVSQNNNIPRIKKIIKNIAASYGESLTEKSHILKCPLNLTDGKPIPDVCKGCGACFSFPSPRDVLDAPELLLDSHPGFRYKYLVDAAEKVHSGEVDLEKIAEKCSSDFAKEELKKIKGVGDKVAFCISLFAFSNLNAFPIDVWMRRAIDEYFGGELDPASLGEYAGVAQQYIFHYIRILNSAK